MAGPTPYCIPTTEIIAPIGTIVSIGDIVTGPGFQSGTTVVAIGTNSYNQVVITLNQPPWTGSIVPAGVDGDPCDASVPTDWFSKINFTDPQQIEKTISFSEQTKGWVSFKSFTPENAISVANDYYTFNNAKLFKHHVEDVDRNTFYEGEVDFPFIASSFNVILNNAPGSIKSFNTLNYEGSQSKVDIDLDDNQYFNLIAKPGWYVESIETDLEKGSLNEFIDKEGKWFNYLKGQNVITDNNGLIVVNPDGSSSFDQSSFAIQGIGVASSIFCPNCPEITSWNCGVEPPTPPTPPQPATNTCSGLTNLGDWDSFMTVAFASGNQNTLFQNIGTWTSHYGYNSNYPAYASVNADGGRCPDNNWIGPMGPNITTPAVERIITAGPGSPGTATQASDLITIMINAGWNVSQGDSWADILIESENQPYNQTMYVARHPFVDVAGVTLGSCSCSEATTGDPGSPGGALICIPVAGTGGEYQTKLECENNCRGNGNGNGSLTCYQCGDGGLVTSTTNAVHVGDGWVCPQGWTTTIPNCVSCLACDGSQGEIPGCCNPVASNYNPDATCDDGSCVACIYGCTDPLATNFYAGAGCDDGSCKYEFVSATCGNIFTSGALEACDDFLCLLYPNIDPNCSVQTFPNAMALATYWATEITNAANGIFSNNTPYNPITNAYGYFDQNGTTIGTITAQDMYDLLYACCVSPIE